MLVALAWRNLWRRPQRTILSLLSIAIVSTLLICMLSFQISVYGVMKETTLRIFSGYAQFQPLGYADDPGLGAYDRPPRGSGAPGDQDRWRDGRRASGQRLRHPGQWRAQLWRSRDRRRPRQRSPGLLHPRDDP
jgi:hypothetical protein